MLRLLIGCLMAGTVLAGMVPHAAAQTQGSVPSLHLEADGTPLAVVLRDLAQQAGIDIVFAERTVEGKAVSGRYVGSNFEGALRTVLRGSGLRAEQVRRRQYVIVPEGPRGLGLPTAAARGTLEGTVVDATSGEALPGAHVVVAGLELGSVTNTAGYFAIPGLPAGDYRVRVTFIGYRGLEVELPVYPTSKLDRPVIRLDPETLVSAGVVVEGNQDSRADLELLPGTTQVGLRTASAMPGVLGDGDLFSALEWVVGVARTGEAGGELVVRGAEAQYNGYLLDGAPVIHPWHTFGLFSVFQPEALRSVRLHKGSFPAEYGGALSAVVDIEMRDGERGRPGGMVAVSPVSIRGVAETPITDRVSLMLTARRTWFDLLLTPRLRLTSNGGLPSFAFDTRLHSESAGENQQIGYHFYDLGSKLTWRVAPGHRLSLSLYEGGDRLDAEAPLSALTGRSEHEASGGDPSIEPGLGLRYSWGNRIASARYAGLVSERVFVTATGYYSGYRAREQSEPLPRVEDQVETDYRVHVAEIGLRVDADYYLTLQHQVRAGFRVVGRHFSSTLHEHEVRPEDVIVWRDQFDRVRAMEIIAYLQDTWQPSAAWQLQPGLRIEYFGLGGYLSLNPRLHVRRTLQRDRLYLRAGLSRQTQPLHRLRDHRSHSYDIAADRWLPASDLVRPATAWQLATGLEWLPRRWLSLSGEVFARSLYDILLPPDVGAPDGEPRPSELPDGVVPGTSRAMGLELTAEVEAGRWRGGASYSFSTTQERVPGSAYRPARYDSPHQFEAFAIGEHGSWTVSLAGIVRSGYPVTVLGSASGPFAVDDARATGLNNGRLPTYARIDLSVAYAFRMLGLEWNAQAQAYNLLNRRNTVGIQYPGDAVPPVGTNVYGLPILPMVSLKARW